MLGGERLVLGDRLGDRALEAVVELAVGVLVGPRAVVVWRAEEHASIHDRSTQRRWLTTPDIVISGEVGRSARRASSSDSPSHFAMAVPRV